MALYLAREVVDNAYLDLSDCPRGDVVSSNTFSSKASLNEGLVQCSRKKRKLTNGIALEVDAGSRKLVTPISAKIAALRALEALLTVREAAIGSCYPSPDFPVGKSLRFDERIDGTISHLEDDDDVDEHEQAGTEGYQMLTTTDFENTNEISTAQVAVAFNNETATIKGNMIYNHEKDKGDSGTDLMEPQPGTDTDSDS